MLIRSYQDLIADVNDLLSRNDLAGKVAGWIDFCHADLIRTMHNLRDIEVRLESQTLPAAQDYIDVPVAAGLVDFITIESGAIPIRLDRVTLEKLNDVKANSLNAGLSTPKAFTVFERRKIHIAPAPSSNLTYTIYYKKARIFDFDDLSLVTSQALEEAPDMLLYGTAWHSGVYTRDIEGGAALKAIYEQMRDEYDTYLFNVKNEGGSLRVRPNNMPSDHHNSSLS